MSSRPLSPRALIALVAVAALAGCPSESEVTVEPMGGTRGAAPGAADPHAGHNHAPGEGHGETRAAADPHVVPVDPHAAPADPRAGAELPPGHPPVGGPPPAAADTDGHAELPLKKAGLNSRVELDRALAGIANAEVKKTFEEAFRYAFTVRQDLRHYAMAESGFKKVIEAEPGLAEAYRGLAYAVFNRGLRFDEAIPLYKKAVELKPDYGEAHYALAFLYGASDPRIGRDHFKRAMELGIPDERLLRQKYYRDVK